MNRTRTHKADAILSYIVADSGGMNFATAERVGRIAKWERDPAGTVADAANSVGDWYGWNDIQRIAFVVEATANMRPVRPKDLQAPGHG